MNDKDLKELIKLEKLEEENKSHIKKTIDTLIEHIENNISWFPEESIIRSEWQQHIKDAKDMSDDDSVNVYMLIMSGSTLRDALKIVMDKE